MFLLISLCLFAISWSQTLSEKQVKEIQEYIQSLPDKMVQEKEVVVIETDFGNIVIDLFENQATIHAMNFKKLANAGYFDGTTFHRVIQNFVVQGGDILSRDSNPLNDGTGGTGYTLPPEIGMKHYRGSVASARQSDAVNPGKQSNGSQFYICLKDLPHLDKMGYTVFGKVINGMDVVDKISTVDTDERDRPIKDVIMKKVYITTKGDLGEME
jgi:cyclophilin family peptidyl-prolyl cis-trans isomerase